MIPPKVHGKITERIAKLRAWRYEHIAEVTLEYAETMTHFRTPPGNLKYKNAPVGTRWGKEWGSAWFRGKFRVPKGYANRRIYFRMLTWGEMLLFIDGEPFAGLDHRHHEVLLPKKVCAAKQGISFAVEAYAGHLIPGDNPYSPEMRYHQSLQCESREVPLRLESSELLVERRNTTALYYEMDTLYRNAISMGEHSLRRATIIDTLNQALDLVPMEWADSEELETAAKAARQHIADLLKEKNPQSAPSVGIVGHAHIDIGWLWPVHETNRKAARTFSSMIQLIKDYPEMTFLQSQPILIDMIQREYPSLLPKLQALAKSGNWEPNGGMWVEADCNVTSGESLVRQLLEGRKKTMEVFDYYGDTLWLPDVFGYSAALPQILKLCEIDNFVTSKINWNDTNRFPYDTFLWEGIDGTEIFTHFITCRINGYNAEVGPDISTHCWEFVQHKEVQDSVLSSVGYGDGGGGVTREMCERSRLIHDLDGCPKTRFINVSKFLARLRQQDIERPRWVGELYLENHRGTYTTQARSKRYNRKLELLLRDVEFCSLLALECGLEYPAQALENAWRTVLTNQFHDILPGSSIRQVYEVAEAEYAEVEDTLDKLKAQALKHIGSRLEVAAVGDATVVLNSLSWDRDEIIYLDAVAGSTVTNAQGDTLPSQSVTLGETTALAVHLQTPALSVTPISVQRPSKAKAKSSASPFRATKKTLRTPFYQVRFDAAGKITRLFDNDAQRDIVQQGRRLNDLFTCEDFPMQWDAWDIDRFYRDTMVPEDRLRSRKILDDGPLQFTLRSEYAIGRRSTLQQDMIFYAHSRRIDFKTTVNWDESHVVLKVGFPVDIHSHQIRCDIQYGHVLRNTHSNSSYDAAQFEICAHKWVDISENGYGVALLNDCKYGHDTLDNMVSLTLLKSPKCPDPRADLGTHEFTYSLLPHTADFSVEHVVREAYALNVPLSGQKVKRGKTNSPAYALFHVSNPNVIVECIKKAEESGATIIRLYEAGNSRGTVKLTFSQAIKTVHECNLLERKDQPLGSTEFTVRFDILPFQIKTLKVTMQTPEALPRHL